MPREETDAYGIPRKYNPFWTGQGLDFKDFMKRPEEPEGSVKRSPNKDLIKKEVQKTMARKRKEQEEKRLELLRQKAREIRQRNRIRSLRDIVKSIKNGHKAKRKYTSYTPYHLNMGPLPVNKPKNYPTNSNRAIDKLIDQLIDAMKKTGKSQNLPNITAGTSNPKPNYKFRFPGKNYKTKSKRPIDKDDDFFIDIDELKELNDADDMLELDAIPQYDPQQDKKDYQK